MEGKASKTGKDAVEPVVDCDRIRMDIAVQRYLDEMAGCARPTALVIVLIIKEL
ncbi:MAG: hypothetical protein HZB85_02870 [Deltaproteobacteria bacterium]|nr:hypothetical protein [Deltaproteobacteria bacterium]